jgi:hypothetical protein
MSETKRVVSIPEEKLMILLGLAANLMLAEDEPTKLPREQLSAVFNQCLEAVKEACKG